ncbi:MAG: terminase large subunit domain-containing protein [Cetobacterium sp.]|uniref:terminase large subunit domain-containing protein n=1 Tax=Cetobacterium sp. TaxID=2071632 RepID=UPI003EE4ED5A
MNLDKLSVEELKDLLEQLQEVEKYEKYNKMEYYSPYEYQKDFYKAGTKYKRRFLLAANRIGKSFGMAMETSYHLTGLYPKNWEGHRFTHPILAWAVGITSDSTRKVLQKELLGTSVAKVGEEIGTGAIPSSCIDLDSMEREGNIIRLIRIKHHNSLGEFDGYSTLEFRSTHQGEQVLMGATVDYIWVDEEDKHKSMEIYSQCVTRTATTDGHVVITATPENGETALVSKFLNDDSGYLYCQNATWDDAPHLTEEAKAELLASIPEWQREMRSKGLPVFGQGLIFNISNDDITVDNISIKPWWSILWSLDIGDTNDPTVITLNAYDPDNEVYYVVSQECLDKDRSPEAAANFILNSEYPLAPVQAPHDAGDGRDGSAGYATLMRQKGVKVRHEPFRNPVNTKTDQIGVSNRSNRSIETGLYYMNDYFKSGKLKLHKQCIGFLKDKNSYHSTAQGKLKSTTGEHHIDSARYGFMSLLGHKGSPAGQCMGQKRTEWNNGYSTETLNIVPNLYGDRDDY